MQLALDYTTSAALRDAGIKNVSQHSSTWIDSALYYLSEFCQFRKAINRPEFKIEEFRAYINNEPDHPNAWGAFTSQAVKRGIIKFAGRYENAELVSRHGCLVRVWRAI